MPPREHFITGQELTLERAKHLIMSQEDRDWLQVELNRISETMQYKINGRTSMDDALRLFLIADKGFTLEQALDMPGMTPEQMKEYYQEFINTYANPNKNADPDLAAEENMYLIGDMHRRALEKIRQYQFPDFSQIKTVENLYEVHAFFEKLSGLMTSMNQDTQITKPELKLAYYAGAGGKNNFEKLVYPIEASYANANNIFPMLDHPYADYPYDTKAQYLKLCRNQLLKYSNKTIAEMKLPVLFSNSAITRLALDAQLMKGEDKGHHFSEEGMDEYIAYLNGDQNDIPLTPEFEQALSQQIIIAKQFHAGELTNHLANELIRNGYEEYLTCPHPEDSGDDSDIFLLSPEDQKKLQCTYLQMFARSRVDLNVFYEMGLDEFDLIKVRGGETISQMVNRKYPNLDQETKYRALMMETVRHALTDGIMVMDCEVNPQTGVFTLKNGIAIAPKTEAELMADENAAMDNGLLATKAERENLFRKEDGEFIGSVDDLTPEQRENAAGMFDQIFGTALNSINMRNYRVLNPEKQDVDFFRVGGMSLRSFLGERRMNELLNAGLNTLKAEILRMATDPKIPLSLTTVKYDALRDEYSDRNTFHIMDAQDKVRIRTEYPHLRTLNEYKHWKRTKYEGELGQAAQTLFQSFDEETWLDMYYSEYHHAAAEGFTIPRDRVVSPQQLAERAEDQVNPHSQTFENLKTIYGPKPLVVESWVGPLEGTNVYTKENFLQHSPDLSQGNFTDGDFSLLAFYAAMSPDVVVEHPFQDVPEDWISPRDHFRAVACMWTMDISAYYPMPRSNLGDAYLEKAIKPARIAASNSINAYESGNREQMVGILSDGLKNMLGYMKTTVDLAKTDGPTAFKLHMLRKTNEMLDRYPGIRDEVMGRLTEAEKENLKIFLKLEDVLNQSVHAKARLDEAKNNKEVLSPDETAELTKKVDAFNFYAASWERNVLDFRNSPQYQAFNAESARVMLQRMYAAPAGDVGPGDVKGAEEIKYHIDHLAIAPDMKEALLSEYPLNAASRIRGSRDRMVQYYTDEWQKLQQAKATLRRAAGEDQNEADQEEVTPEICDAAVRGQEESQSRLDALRRILESSLIIPEKDHIRDEYNKDARRNNWPEIENFDENIKDLSPAEHPDRYKCYFDLLIKVYQDDIKKCYRIEEKLDGIRIPTDPDFAEKLDHPMKKRFARLDRYFAKLDRMNNDLVAQDKEKIRQAAEHLAEVKENVAASIGRANDLSAGNEIRKENMLRGSEGYNENNMEFSGLLEKRNAGAGTPRVKVITANTREACRRLLENPPEISEALKLKGVTAIQMMEDRSMLEEVAGSRTMAHGRTIRGRTELAAAVERSPIPAIREADDRYLAAFTAEEEVFNYIKDSFTADAWVPENMTLTGEKKVPPKFVLDPKVDSRMNAIWQVGMTAKRLGVSAEDFIKNPGAILMQDLRTKLTEKGRSSMTEPGDDFITSVGKLYTKGRELARSGGLKAKVLGGLTGEEYVEKAIGNLYLMEEDPERRKSLASYTRKLGQLVDAAVDREYAECVCIYQTLRNGNRTDRKSAEAVREGLKAAFFSGGAIGKEHLPVPYTNAEGIEADRPVKYQDILARKNAYAELTAIYKKNLPNAKTSDRQDMKLLIQETMLEYLMAHPEDRDKKEYKNLEKLALNADVEMQIPQPANAAERGKRPKERYNNWKQDFAAELRNLDNAVVRRDQGVNRDILRLQREAEAAVRGNNPDRALAWEKMEEIEIGIQERQIELLNAWQKKEITDSYFKARYDDLNAVLKNPGQRLKNPPKFTDKRNAVQYAEDLKMVSNRVSYSFEEGYLKNLDSFKEWKREQWDANPDVLNNYSQADWKKQYRNELYNEVRRRGTPNWVKEKRGEALASIQTRRQRRQQELEAQNNNAAQNNAVQNNNVVQNNNAAQNNAGVQHAPGRH